MTRQKRRKVSKPRQQSLPLTQEPGAVPPSSLEDYDLRILAARYVRFRNRYATDERAAQIATEIVKDPEYVVELELCLDKGKPQQAYGCRLPLKDDMGVIHICGYRA